MTRKEALALILRNYPGERDARITQIAVDALRDRQLEAAASKFDGWPFLRREGLVRFDGGYDTGTVTVTNGSASVTGSGTTFPTNCAGWMFAPKSASTERYKIKSRDSATQLTLERPYIGDTESGISYSVYDRRGYLPIDYYQGESLVFEAGSRRLGVTTIGYARAGIAKSVSLGNALFVFLTEVTKTAYQSSNTVTIAQGDATVTIDTSTWPGWCVGAFLRFAGESVWYRIASRTDDNNVELDRPYGGENGGSGVAYELDPPGSYQVEYEVPREDNFTVRVVYFRVPEELVNDNDILEGPDPYARAICNLAAADVLSSLPRDAAEQYQPMIQSLVSRGQGQLDAMTKGKPEPNMEAVLHDIRHTGKMNFG